jgi:hypothetical protein
MPLFILDLSGTLIGTWTALLATAVCPATVVLAERMLPCPLHAVPGA